MLPGKKYTVDDILRILRKHLWVVVIPPALGLCAGVFVAKSIPELYKSETLIMVVPKRVPDSYVKPTDTTRIEDRLLSITEQIQSRSRLERIIHEFNLYERERANGVMEDVVDRMRRQIGVNLEGQSQESFRIAYTSSNPRIAQQVTARLASWYIEESLKDRENLAENINQFLAAELDGSKRRLVEHEEKLEEYRRRYSGQLPSQLDSNLQSMQTVQMQLQGVSETINRAQERRLLVERQIADIEALPTLTSGGESGNPNAEAAPLSAAQQLEAAQAALARGKLRYTPDHPDIRALERTIKDLQVRAEEELRSTPAVAGQAKPMSSAELVRQRRIKDLKTEIESIDRQIAAGRAEHSRLQASIAGYQAKIDVVPERESELVNLMRDYTTLQNTYASLLAKRVDSNLAANLERRQIGEQFKVLDPASLPERPVNASDRIRIMLGGLGAGLFLGVLCVGFLEYRDSSYKTEADVRATLSLPVLALVPMMFSERDQRANRRKRVMTVLAAVVVLLGSAALTFWRIQS
jgi:polysaccharide chain length determinant protein (PEP-CTERM system associated)